MWNVQIKSNENGRMNKETILDKNIISLAGFVEQFCSLVK
jgi:hypothetical protein